MKPSHHPASGPAALPPAHKARASKRLQNFTSPHFVQHAMVEGRCGGAAPPPCQVAPNVALQGDSSGGQQLGTCRAVGACRPGSGQQCTGLADAQVKGCPCAAAAVLPLAACQLQRRPVPGTELLGAALHRRPGTDLRSAPSCLAHHPPRSPSWWSARCSPCRQSAACGPSPLQSVWQPQSGGGPLVLGAGGPSELPCGSSCAVGMTALHAACSTSCGPAHEWKGL